MKPNVFLKSTFAITMVLLTIGTVGFLSQTWVKNSAQKIVTDTLPGLSAAGAANANLSWAFNRTLLLLLEEDPVKRASLTKEIEDASSLTTAELARYKQQIYEPEDLKNFEHLLSHRTNYLNVRIQMMALANNNQHKEAVDLCDSHLVPAYLAYRDAGEVLLRYNTAQGEAQGKSIMQTCAFTRVAVSLIAIGVFVVGFFIGLFR